MADPNNESKQPVDGDQPPPPAYQQPVGFNPAAPNYNAPPPTTMNPIAAQPSSMTPYPPGQGMQAGSFGGAPQQPISMAPFPGQGALLGAQQQQVQWMMPPPASPDCPPGLECLTQLDQINLGQQLNLVELVRNIDMPNRYDIMNKFGQQVFRIAEEPLPFNRDCCSRMLHIRGYDNNQKEVLHFSRLARCGCCCCIPCITDCMEDMTVEAPTGNIIGFVVQTTRLGPDFDILDSERNKMLQIKGPFGCCACYGVNTNYTFQATDTNDQNVGAIVKHWAGMPAVATLDRFSVNFALNLDVKQKALLMAASILIDFMLFQRQQPNNYRRG